MAVRLRIVASILLLAAVAACTVPGQTPVRSTAATPSSTPSLTCTGTGPAPSPFPCDGKTRDAEQRTLEDQAKATYERYWKEYTRLVQAGGATEATPELKATVAEPMLDNVVSLLRYQAGRGLKPNPFKATLTLEVRSDAAKADAEVSLTACEDTRGSVFLDASGKEGGVGVINTSVVALKRIEGNLKIYSNDEGTSTCPIG